MARTATSSSSAGRFVEQRYDFDRLPLEKIVADKELNVRKKYPDLEELGNSIKRDGLLQPVGVRYDAAGDVFQLAYGFRRYFASELKGLPTIRAVLVVADPKVPVTLIENIQRVDLSDFETGKDLLKIKASLGSKATNKDVAEHVSKTEQWVKLRIGVVEPLIRASAGLTSNLMQEKILDLSASVVNEIRGVSENERTRLLRLAAERGLTARQVRAEMDVLARPESKDKNSGEKKEKVFNPEISRRDLFNRLEFHLSNFSGVKKGQEKKHIIESIRSGKFEV